MDLSNLHSSNITLNSDVSVDTSVVINVTVQDDQSIASHQETDAGNEYLFSNFSIRTLSEFGFLNDMVRVPHWFNTYN